MNNPIVRARPSANALFCNVIVVKIPLTLLLGEFLLGANFRMFYLSKCSFVNVIASTMTHPKLLEGRYGIFIELIT